MDDTGLQRKPLIPTRFTRVSPAVTQPTVQRALYLGCEQYELFNYLPRFTRTKLI